MNNYLKCSKELSGRQKTYCSRRCCSSHSILANRPLGENHYLWSGGESNRKRYIKEYKIKFRERYLARQKISDAIRRGKIKRQPCQICGIEKSEAHHKDYSKPFEVIWLCRMHHRVADKALGIGSIDF